MKNAFMILGLVAVLSSCSSCGRKKLVQETDLDYKDFELVDENKDYVDEEIEPSTQREYNLKIRVVRRTYLV
jgi:hypothetical protein